MHVLSKFKLLGKYPIGGACNDFLQWIFAGGSSKKMLLLIFVCFVFLQRNNAILCWKITRITLFFFFSPQTDSELWMWEKERQDNHAPIFNNKRLWFCFVFCSKGMPFCQKDQVEHIELVLQFRRKFLVLRTTRRDYFKNKWQVGISSEVSYLVSFMRAGLKACHSHAGAQERSVL